MTDYLSDCCLAAVEAVGADAACHPICQECGEANPSTPVDELSDEQMERAASKWERCDHPWPAYLTKWAAAGRLLERMPRGFVCQHDGELIDDRDRGLEDFVFDVGEDAKRAVTLAACRLRARQIEPREVDG